MRKLLNTLPGVSSRRKVKRGRKLLLKWRQLPTDDGATFDKSLTLNASDLVPMITYGTNPGMGMKITDHVPDPDSIKDESQKLALTKALNYMGLKPNQPMLGQPINVVFIGSCTNSRISDLRLAASLMKDRQVANGVRALIVPGSQEIKKASRARRLGQNF